jgi:hypothetical protein
MEADTNPKGVLGENIKMNTDIDEVTIGKVTVNTHRSNSKENQSVYQSKIDM